MDVVAWRSSEIDFPGGGDLRSGLIDGFAETGLLAGDAATEGELTTFPKDLAKEERDLFDGVAGGEAVEPPEHDGLEKGEGKSDDEEDGDHAEGAEFAPRVGEGEELADFDGSELGTAFEGCQGEANEEDLKGELCTGQGAEDANTPRGGSDLEMGVEASER